MMDGFQTKKKRFFIHYLPLILLLFYCLVFYIIVFFFPPCKNDYDNSSAFCINCCLIYDYIYSMWETIVHQILPALIIIVIQYCFVCPCVMAKTSNASTSSMAENIER